MREKLLKLSKAYRLREESVTYPKRGQCIGICYAVGRPEFGFTRREADKVHSLIAELRDAPGVSVKGFKWAYDDWDSRASWLLALALCQPDEQLP